jgi:hypothetical protein
LAINACGPLLKDEERALFEIMGKLANFFFKEKDCKFFMKTVKLYGGIKLVWQKEKN